MRVLVPPFIVACLHPVYATSFRAGICLPLCGCARDREYDLSDNDQVVFIMLSHDDVISDLFQLKRGVYFSPPG